MQRPPTCAIAWGQNKAKGEEEEEEVEGARCQAKQSAAGGSRECISSRLNESFASWMETINGNEDGDGDEAAKERDGSNITKLDLVTTRTWTEVCVLFHGFSGNTAGH